MKAFNISKQNPNLYQQWIKEYINRMLFQTKSLINYTKYYNPEWRIINVDGYEMPDGIKSTDLFLYNDGVLTGLDFSKLAFRWGFRNETDHTISLSGTSNSLSIGATIYKIDSTDLGQDSNDWLNHFLVFESSLAQFYNWNIQTTDNIDYHIFMAREDQFGLEFPIQLFFKEPRYFYYSGTSGVEYKVDFADSNLRSNSAFDYQNRVFTGIVMQGAQVWCGNSYLSATCYYDKNDDGTREEVLGDIVVAQNQTGRSSYKVYIDENLGEDERPSAADRIYVELF